MKSKRHNTTVPSNYKNKETLKVLQNVQDILAVKQILTKNKLVNLTAKTLQN